MQSPSYQPSIYINLSVASLDDSIKFYSALGFKQNPKFTGKSDAMMALAPNEDGVGFINIMLISTEFFKSFFPSDIERQFNEAGKTRTTEVVFCLSAESRDDVDAINEKAKAAGGRTGVLKLPNMTGMYGGSFEDLDGHVWETLWMSKDLEESGH